MLKLAKLFSPNNQRYAKSPYANSTKNSKNAFFAEKTRRDNNQCEILNPPNIQNSFAKESRFRASYPSRLVRTHSNEGSKPKPGRKNLNISLLDETKLKGSKSTTRVPQARTGSRRSQQNYEIDIFLRDLTCSNISERRNLEILFLSRWIEMESESRYLVSGKWMEQYTKFLGGDTEMPPGAIDNSQFKNTPLAKNSLIFSVNEFIWCFLNLLYGGGPEFRIPNSNSHQSNSETSKSSFLILTDAKPSLDSQKYAPVASVNALKRMSPEKRRENESKFFKLHMNTKTKINYFVNEEWIDEYLNYLNGNGPIPGLIDNSMLKQKFDIREYHGNCYTLNEIVWNFLSILYEINQEIGIRDINFQPGTSADIIEPMAIMQEIDQKRRNNNLPNANEELNPNNFGLTTKGLLGLPLRVQEFPGKRDPNCFVCIDSVADTIFIPCGHRSCCYPDAQETIKKSNRCPLCKNFIEGFMKSFDKKACQNIY